MGSADPLHDQLNQAGDHFALVIETSDAARGVAALADISAETDTLAPVAGATAPRLSAIAPLPDGVVLRIDDLSNRVDTRRRLADTTRSALADHGFGDDAIAVLPVDGLSDLDRCRRAAVVRLFPEPAGSVGRLDPSWIDVAAEWVFGDQRPDAQVRIRVLGVERSVRAAEAAGVLHGCAASHVWCDVVTGDLDARIRTASISFGAAPHVAIAGGGPRCDDDGLLARFELLREVVRELADDCAYACLDFESTFADLGTGLSNTEWALEGGASPNTVAGRLCDRFVPEVFAYQLLSPMHLGKLRAADPDRHWGDPLGGRFEVPIGEPEDWLPTSEVRGDVRADGWELLAPVLLRGEQLADELERAARDGALTQRPVDHREAAAGHGLPELDAIIIEAESHSRRGTRLSALELTAWLAGEPHSDSPSTVSPVLRTFVRQLGFGLDATRRQELKGLAARLVGTAAGADVDDPRRSLRLTDWLVRGQAPPWLRSAGLTESADRLDRLASIADDADLVRAVDLLGNAIVTAGRRLEITTAIAGDDADVVDQIAWDAWEEAAERSGWIAATDGVLHGIPADLAYAADQRVIECSRDPRVRAELEASSRGLGDAIWSAALQEIAAAAWRGAWEATEAFVHHESTFSIRTALRRSLETLVGDDDIVVVEGMLEEVDHEARDALAHLVLDADGEVDYWKRAVDAASEGETGQAWRRALDSTRDVLGATLYDDAIGVARAELHRWLDRAPELVGRVVAAAVAREASGVAGRAVAARAAAEKMARSGTVEDGETAAREAIAPIVAALADEAVTLVLELSGTLEETAPPRAV